MSAARKRLFHPIFFGLFPTLFLFACNADDLSLRSLWLPLTLTMTGALLTWGFYSLWIRDPQRAAAMTSLTLFLFFSYGHALDIVQGWSLGPFQIAGHKDLGSLWIAFFLMGVLLLFRMRGFLNVLTLQLNATSALLILFSLVYGSWNFIDGHHLIPALQEHPDQPAGPQPNQRLPDIYYIILDGYARADVLEEVYHYDNSPFIRWLQEKGFYVASLSRPNYANTLTSLSSSMNMSYLDSLATLMGPNSKNLLPFQRLIRYGAVLRFLKQAGYTLVSFSTGVSGTEIRNADVYLTPPLGLTGFQNELLNTTAIPALLKSYDLQRKLHRLRILYTLEHLPRATRLEGPTFVFAHIVCPHPPYIFDKEGHPAFLPRRFSFTPDETLDWQAYAQRYTDQLSFITGKVQAAIEQILKNSPSPPIIVLQSDHGPGFHAKGDEKQYLRERIAILNAYYFPDKDYSSLYEEISPVNTFRIIFNQYLVGGFPLLGNRSYTSKSNFLYDFKPVLDQEEGCVSSNRRSERVNVTDQARCP